MTKNTNTSRYDSGIVFLTALLAGTLAIAQVTAAKIIPFFVPFLGALTFTGGTIAYAVTYTATDALTELYGRTVARNAVIAGFLTNIVIFGILWFVVTLPTSAHGAPQSAIVAVLGSGMNIILGSMSAYIVSQNIDISIFHRLDERTDGRFLWLRNNGSTIISQCIDTAIFVSVAFLVAPALLGFGVALPIPVLVTVFIGDYIAKTALAIADTPVVYAFVWFFDEDDTTLTDPPTDPAD